MSDAVDDIRENAGTNQPHLFARQPFRYPLTRPKGLGERIEGISASLAVEAEEMGLLGEAIYCGLTERRDEDVDVLAGRRARSPVT
jgi:hypothetical protein